MINCFGPKYLDDVDDVPDGLLVVIALLVPPAFLGEPGLEVEALLSLVLEHGVKLLRQDGVATDLLLQCSIHLRHTGVGIAYMVEEIEDDVFVFRLAHRRK